MRYEWTIAIRYLLASRGDAAPSLMTVLSILAVAVGVAAMILVLSIMGGFEGDLRDKILASRAHLLVTGEYGGEIDEADEVVGVIEAIDGVVGASPYLESELMISSPTNFSGAVVRGIDIHRIGTTSELPEEIEEGRLEWLLDPDAARRRPLAPPGTGFEIRTDRDGDVAGRIERLRAQTEALRDEMERLRGSGDAAFAEPKTPRDRAREGRRSTNFVDELADPFERRGTAGDEETQQPTTAMPALPPPASARNRPGSGEGPATSPMPALPAPRGQRTDAEAERAMPPLPGTDRQRARRPSERPGRVLEGLVVGRELARTLNVRVGDRVNVISPDGDLSPAGPIPRSRPFRVVGVFYTGLYEYDNKLAFTTLDAARAFLDRGDAEVTGVEVKIAEVDAARAYRERAEAALEASGRGDAEVKDWMQLNSNLFSALLLEKIAMFVILSFIILVAGFAIVCVLTMVVIDKSREIAVLKSMGAPRSSIIRIFLVDGGAIGLVGTIAGLIVGLGITTALQTIGFPLDPETYYIDRLPVEVDALEVVSVVVAAIAVSLLATIYPSMQAARLDPVEGLRTE